MCVVLQMDIDELHHMIMAAFIQQNKCVSIRLWTTYKISVLTGILQSDFKYKSGIKLRSEGHSPFPMSHVVSRGFIFWV